MMQRGVYFDGWYPNQHCYHPSLPPRRIRMVEDLDRMHATILVWSALGGGSISLPYLEGEAFGEIPERFRTYGFVNDAEFIRLCEERGIEVFGIVFECQGWEFPAEVVDGKVVAFNELRGEATQSWLGLGEFTRDEGPDQWKPFRHYFPEGLVNSRGQQVTDLFEECASRGIDGSAYHAHWVEAPDRAHRAHLMDRNNPVWREYLKAIVRIQIDAGVAGVQLDESGSPLEALRYGGCFCADCTMQFRRYLEDRSVEVEADAFDAVGDLSTFDYGEWLRAQGYGPGAAPQTLPLHDEYVRFQRRASAATFKEIADYVRDYAAEKGRAVKVAGNFYECFPYYDAMVPNADVMVTEMKITGDRQPWWFRHAAVFGQGKPVVVVENPYGGVIPDLVDELHAGRGYDRFRISIYEAAAMGVNMTLPYGSWLGSQIEDSYWAPRALSDEVADFLQAIDGLLSATTANDVAVVYSVLSHMRAAVDGDAYDDQGRFYPVDAATAGPVDTYWDAVALFCDHLIPYDPVILPDEALRPTTLTAESLSRYRTVVFPACRDVSPTQHAAFLGYLEQGGQAVVQGDYGVALDPAERALLVEHPGCVVVADISDLPGHVERQVDVELPLGACNIQALPDGTHALHLINYDYDGDTDAIRVVRDAELIVRTAGPVRGASWHVPGRSAKPLKVTAQDGTARMTIPELGTYGVIHLA
jgi:hypothetical protein